MIETLIQRLALLLVAGMANASAAQNECSLGVFPFLSAQRLESIFAPIAAELGKDANCKIRYVSVNSFRRFMDRLAKRKYELAFIQPFDYVRVAVPSGYLPLAARDSQLRGTIVTRQDSKVNSLTDLRGKTVALPPSVAAVSYLTRAALQQAGIDPKQDVKLVYTKNHGSCMQQVLIGKADACGTVNTVVSMFENKNRIKLKWLAQTPAIPQALFVVRDDIPLEKREQLLQSLLTIQLDEAGMQLFKDPDSDRIFRKIEDKEYDIVRQYWRRFKPDKAN